ncbi:MAG: hypothetical protein ABI655_06020 [Phenylobacterium sp.]
MDNQDPIAAGEDLARVDDDLPIEDVAEPEDDLFELELDGQVHSLPAELKGAFLRQADYTRKTQELAGHRRAVEAERQALAQHRQAAAGVTSDRAHLAALDQQLSMFGGVDWRSLAQAQPQRAQALWGQFQQTQAVRERYAYAVAHHEHGSRLAAVREAAEQMAQTGRTLQQEIEGWSPEVAGKLVEYAKAFGVTLEELAQAADPRVWKILHRAYQADQASQKDGAARTAVQAQAVRAAVLVSGTAAGGGGVRDELATKEWMARRNEQKRRGR